jgi:hypothetical protein
MSRWKKFKSSKGWVVLFATIIALGFGGYTFVNRAVTTQVYVTNCGILDYKPVAMLKYCGDTSVGIDEITWLSWSAKGAAGEGIYQINDCEPSCDAGKLHYAEVQITVNKAKIIDGKQALTFISITTKDGKILPLSQSPIDEWPLELAG